MTAALEAGEWQQHTPAALYLPGKTRYPIYRRLGGSEGRYGRAENLVPTGIRSRTLQPVAHSLYRLSYPAYTNTHTHTHKHIYICVCVCVCVCVNFEDPVAARD